MADEESYWELFLLNFKVRYRNFIEYCKVATRFYSNRQFSVCDLKLLSEYVWKNPFKISKEFLLAKGESDPYAYGETPLTSLEIIAKKSGITSTDVVFELGCGRGRGCFWLNSFYGCKVVGIDFVPLFIQKANKVKDRYQVKGVEFRCEDMLKADFSEGTIFYLYGTCLDEDFIKKLIKKFEKLPKGTKIITVSYPLSDYARDGRFTLIKQFPVPFTWGEGLVYLQKI